MIQNKFRFVIYSFLGVGVLGVFVFGVSSLSYGNYVSAQSDEAISQLKSENVSPSEPTTFKLIVGPWFPVIFILLMILTFSVVFKVLRHPK